MSSNNNKILDGKLLSQNILEFLKEYSIKNCIKPKLVVITVEPSSATLSYLKHKKLACENLGWNYEIKQFFDITQDKLIQTIQDICNQPENNGVIIQLPLPSNKFKQWEVVQTVSPEKDIDGLTAQNQGCIQLGLQSLIPCTPQGILELLYHYNLIEKSKYCVVLGRSPLVGKPLANLLYGREGNLTVTVLHRHSENVEKYLQQADIIISCVGKHGIVTASNIKSDAILIDVGINFIDDVSKKSGKRMVGDFTTNCYKKAKYYTPVPGGIGPMTIAMLMRNLLVATQRQYKLPELQNSWRELARQ